MTSAVPLLHLGSLHPYETVLLVVLAFGPFLALGLVVWLQRRRVAAEETAGSRDTF